MSDFDIPTNQTAMLKRLDYMEIVMRENLAEARAQGMETALISGCPDNDFAGMIRIVSELDAELARLHDAGLVLGADAWHGDEQTDEPHYCCTGWCSYTCWCGAKPAEIVEAAQVMLKNQPVPADR